MLAASFGIICFWWGWESYFFWDMYLWEFVWECIHVCEESVCVVCGSLCESVSVRECMRVSICMCVRVCMCLCVWVRVCVSEHLYVLESVCESVSVYASEWVCMWESVFWVSICMCESVCEWASVCVWASVSVCESVCVRVCICVCEWASVWKSLCVSLCVRESVCMCARGRKILWSCIVFVIHCYMLPDVSAIPPILIWHPPTLRPISLWSCPCRPVAILTCFEQKPLTWPQTPQKHALLAFSDTVLARYF